MDQQEILSVLRKFKRMNADKYRILQLGVFGSVARNEAKNDSDVDVVVRIERPDLFLLAGIKLDLEERLNRSVDLVTYRDTMNPFLKQKIDGDVVYA
ncbi:MAG: nucleotidyltransferase domain-containing protein [Proteobacteria bacterium]|nr:nucleotidyltransferase domain-containing protein [Pseudomonadota bacterium]